MMKYIPMCGFIFHILLCISIHFLEIFIRHITNIHVIFMLGECARACCESVWRYSSNRGTIYLDNSADLVQVLTWHRTYENPLPKPIYVTQYVVTRLKRVSSLGRDVELHFNIILGFIFLRQMHRFCIVHVSGISFHQRTSLLLLSLFALIDMVYVHLKYFVQFLGQPGKVRCFVNFHNYK